jgi:hypothetical protein
MNTADATFAVLSVVMAACTASYLWIFFYRPAAFRFSYGQLQALVWYKRVPGFVYVIFAGLGLVLMLVNGVDTALWWAPRTWTVRLDGEERPVMWLAALAIGGFSTQFVMSKMEEIAQKISATKNET